MRETIELSPIGKLHSPFKEKFGIPRQASLIQSCSAEIELYEPYNDHLAVKGLEDFSDIWLIFGFHQTPPASWRPLVRPPRLGGNKKIGVFASRSPFRPNNLGLSRVELRGISIHKGKASLTVSCPDIVDGTPIYDIKPYLHYADANAQARCGFAPDSPEIKLKVFFSSSAEVQLHEIAAQNPSYMQLKTTLEEVLQYDPRPAYKDAQEQTLYGMKLYEFNIQWYVKDQELEVVSVTKIIN